MDDKPKTKRRRLRYSLRTLLVLVTIACAGFGWLGLKVRQAQRQREAVKAIQELGGIVFYDYQRSGMWGIDQLAPKPGPEWLRNIFGDDFLTNVIRVEFFGPSFTDAGMVHLLCLPQLNYLCLDKTRITDAGMVHLQEFNKLEFLSMYGTKISDAGLSYLRSLTQLKSVHLYGTQVTNKGCQELQKALPNLEIYRTLQAEPWSMPR